VKGKITWVTPSGDATYDISTEAGFCRAAVFNGLGQVVGGHHYGLLELPNGLRHPGCHPETGKLPKTWASDYQIPPIVPQAGESGYIGYDKSMNQRTEFLKVQSLRTDADLRLFCTDYVCAKPSTRMLADEIAKFWEPVAWEPKEPHWKEAMIAVLMLEREASMPFEAPTIEKIREVVRAMDKEDTNAGSDAPGESQHDLLLELGDGDLELGIENASRRVLACYEDLCAGKSEGWIDLLETWTIQGKRDRYKPKKLLKGRSIQAPCFTLKALWKACFGEADTHWISRDWMFRAGFDYDLPVKPELLEVYEDTLASLGLDESEFDRRITREMLMFFFKIYMPYMCPGVPEGLLDAVAKATIESVLVLTDGRMYRKLRGNPSGFPNTLRLNCVVQLLAWCYTLAMKVGTAGEVVSVLTEDVFLEICGDDSRANVLTEKGLELLDAHNGFAAWLQLWRDELPWAVKVEGSIVFERESDGTFRHAFSRRARLFPPMIGRTMVVVDGWLWQPLHNVCRTCSKLLHHEPGRTPEMEQVLRGSFFTTCRLHTYWHLKGKMYVPAVAGGIKNGWLTKEVLRIVLSSVSKAYRYGQVHCRKVRER
jgi:hypothetical protein